MTDRNKSGQFPETETHHAGGIRKITGDRQSDKALTLGERMGLVPRRFYVSLAGTRTPAPVVNKPTREIPATPGASKPTRELPAETLAFLKECCK